MSDFIKISVIVLIIYCVWDYMKENNLTLVEMFTTFPAQNINNSVDNSMENVNVTINNQRDYNYNNVSDNSNVQETSYQLKPEVSNDDVIVKPLGNVDYSDLTDACSIIKESYGFNCTIGEPEPITPDLYISGTEDIINAHTCYEKFYTKRRVVYIVDKRLWATGDFLRGYAAINAGFVIVRGEKSFLKETIIHEMGHTFGLGHCDDLSCIMATNNDQYDTGRFCNKCRNKISHFFN